MYKSNIPVFLSSDNNFAQPLAVTMASILYNTKSFIEFYILDGGISKENKMLIKKLSETFKNFSVEFLKIDLSIFEGIEVKNAPFLTHSAYNRFMIADINPNIDRAIYLDVDVIALGDITELYGQDLQNYSTGAFWEEFYDASKNIPFVSSEHKYFSSGVLLIDCKKWREENVSQKLIQIAKDTNAIRFHNDQDTLNIYFDNNYKILDRKFNYLNQNINYYKEKNPEIVIRHFEGPIKPWHLLSLLLKWQLPNFEDWCFYAKMTPSYEKIKEDSEKNSGKYKQILIKLLRKEMANK